MENLDFYLRNINELSIKDLNDEVDIGDSKWNFLFKKITEESHDVYFYGSRLDFKDSDFDATVSYLAHEILDDSGGSCNRLIFTFKPISVEYGRRLMSKLWSYYELPSILFVNNDSMQKQIMEAYFSGYLIQNLGDYLQHFFIIFKGFELDVVLVRSDNDLSEFFKQYL